MKTKKAYAMFIRKKDGNLYPLYVLANEPAPIGVWLEAREDAEYFIAENGRKYLKNSKLSRLAFRPGKHLATVPLFNQIGKKRDGKLVRKPNSVICEVEYVADHDWTKEAIERSKEINDGKVVKWDCCLDHLPYDGYYNFNTNTKALVDWIIVHRYKVNRILSETEVDEICRANGFEPQPF